MELKRLKSNKGSATLVAFLFMGMLLLLGMTVLTTSEDEVTIAGNELQEMKAFYAAEAGLERATASLQTEYDSTGMPTLTVPEGEEEINGCVVSYAAEDKGPATQRPLSQGELAGLNALVKEYSVVSTGVSHTDHAQVALSRKLEVALVPIFQFAVFYNNDLEIAPGADMSLIGRVHTNGNLYLQSNNTLKMESFVTASGDIYHGRKGPGGAGTGDVQIKDGVGNYISMKDGSDWLDAHDSYWYNESIARWQGRVRDAAHGVKELNLPMTDADDPHKVIERADGNPDSYENKATLIIKDGVVTRKNSSGEWQDVTAEMTAAGALTYTNDKFYDQREGKWVDCTELDVSKMYSTGYAPTNGVVYFSDEVSGGSNWPALRLTDGSTLGSSLTVASENPLYTLGDFNSVNKKPASLMADAITYLSNDWKTKNYDTLSTAAKTSRTAANTTVNASYLTGNVETTSSDYSGGFENLPRFLEDWTNKTMTWKGSAVNLWNSLQAIGTWNGDYYTPPGRAWQFDTDLNDPTKLPPETPCVRVFQMVGWQQQYVGYAPDRN
jgi:hypothetical protein